MPTCKTKYFGDVDYADEALIDFVRGPAGFEEETKFLILSYPHQYPLVFVQSITSPNLCFVALPVLAVNPKYRLQMEGADAAVLGVPEQPTVGTQVLCLALVTGHEQTPTANLLAPIVVNLKSRRAMQCIHADGWYSHQHPLLSAEEQAVAV
jgi:flagellar assembly factor FliW